MGTRGIYGFKKNNEYKVTYSHCDSYPSWLGKKIVEYIKSHSIEEMNEVYERIILIEEDFKIESLSKEQIEKYKRILNKDELIEEDMYYLLCHNKLNLRKYDNKEIDLMVDSFDFIQDIFCIWGYIINLDENILEIWGENKEKLKKRNKYKIKEEYYLCEKIKEIKIEEIKKENFSLKKVLKNIYRR